MEEAQREIERAIALEPRSGEYRFALGRLLLQRRPTPETLGRALRELDQALALGVPDPAGAHCYRGLCLQRQGRWQESLAALENSVRLAPEASRAYHALATSYAKLGKQAEARAALARFRPLRERESARQQRSFYEQEAERNRDDPEANFQLGAYLESRGDLVGAVQALRRAAELAVSRKAPADRRLRIHRRLEALYRGQGLRREADMERIQLRRLERAHAG